MPPASDCPKKGGKGLVNELCHAVKTGDMRTLRSVLKSGADINHEFQADGGLSPIFLAIMKKNEEMVKFLISQACDVDKIGTKRQTPLFYAIRSGKPKLVKLLLEAGCNVNHISDQGPSCPIFTAMQQGNTEIVQLLLDYGVDLNCVGSVTKPLYFGISLYRHSFEEEQYVTRRRSPMSIIDVIHMIMARLDWALQNQTLQNIQLDLYMMDMCKKGHDLTIFKDMMKHGARVGGFVYLQYFRIGSTPPPCNFFTPQFFHFFATAHQFYEIYAEFIPRFADFKETHGNRELLAYVKEYFQQPPDLETLCCQRIRKELTVNRWERVDALNIPVALKEMLKLSNY